MARTLSNFISQNGCGSAGFSDFLGPNPGFLLKSNDQKNLDHFSPSNLWGVKMAIPEPFFLPQIWYEPFVKQFVNDAIMSGIIWVI